MKLINLIYTEDVEPFIQHFTQYHKYKIINNVNEIESYKKRLFINYPNLDEIKLIGGVNVHIGSINNGYPVFIQLGGRPSTTKQDIDFWLQIRRLD